MIYKSFEFYFYNYIPILYVYSKKYNINFSICLTEIQKLTFDKLWDNGANQMLINAIKRQIDDYIKYIEN